MMVTGLTQPTSRLLNDGLCQLKCNYLLIQQVIRMKKEK